MSLRNLRQIREFVPQRLEEAPMQRKIVMIYAGLALGMTVLVTVLNHLLGLQIDNYGGLSNLGKKSLLSSIQSMLPIAQSVVTMCLEIGYVAAMLRIARGMYSSPQTLRLGFDRFWVLLRCSVLKGLILSGVMVGCVYIGMMIFIMTPFARPAMEIMEPIVSQLSVLNSELVIDDAVYMQLVRSMVPGFAISGIVLLVLGGPIFYALRMTNYVIIDKPGMGALAAMRASRKMMRGNRRQLLKLDISFWWYYLATAAAAVICYGDVLLPMLGISLPVSEEIAYFGFYGLYLLVSFAIFVLLRNRVEVTYALAYDAVKPEEKQDGGVVLGNIFQM